MAILAKFSALFMVALIVLASEPERSIPDTLVLDTTIVAQLDSASVTPHTVTSGWLIPLAILGATAGVFVILFSARTKS